MRLRGLISVLDVLCLMVGLCGLWLYYKSRVLKRDALRDAGVMAHEWMRKLDQIGDAVLAIGKRVDELEARFQEATKE